jgi:hypothetical protein
MRIYLTVADFKVMIKRIKKIKQLSNKIYKRSKRSGS